MSLSISQMASVVQKDLEALGFVGVSLTTSQPSVQTGEKLICIRKGSSDYHFMRYDAGSWYHKPGFTSILKYKYQPTNSRVWIGEYVDMSGNAYLSSTTYTSDIYFIKYSESLFTTTVSNNTVTITGVKQGVTLSGSVEIPSTINGQAVVAIGNSAFANQTQLSQITIPASVKSIGEYAFKNCYNLTNVIFQPNSQLSSVGGGAFAYCYHLTNLLLPNGLTIQTFNMDRLFIVDVHNSTYMQGQYSESSLFSILKNACISFEPNGDFFATCGTKSYGTFTFTGEYEIHGKTCYMKAEIEDMLFIADGTYYGYFEIFELENNILAGNLIMENIPILNNSYTFKISMETKHHNHHHDPVVLYSTNTSMGRNMLYFANQFALISGGGYGDYTEVTYDPVKNAVKVKATRDDVTHLYVHINRWDNSQTWVNANKRISWVVEVDTGTATGSNITFDLKGKNFNLPPNSIEFSMSGAQTKQFRNTTYVISGISSYALHRNFLVIDVSGLDDPTLVTFYIKMVVVNCCYL